MYPYMQFPQADPNQMQNPHMYQQMQNQGMGMPNMVNPYYYMMPQFVSLIIVY